MSAFDTQVGGGHYKNLAIQPMQYSMANGLDACQHTIIKYVTRFREKGGVADLEKAKHVIEMLIELEMVAAKEGDQHKADKPEEPDALHAALIAALKERFGDDIIVRVLGD
jgi:hypothetical protein